MHAQAYQTEVEHAEARIVVLSELWLDQAGTLDRLDAILTGEQKYSSCSDEAGLNCTDATSREPGLSGLGII